MLILHNARNEKETTGTSIAVIFGVGLIGAHVVRNLNRYQYKAAHDLPFSWQDSTHRKKEKSDILDCIWNLVTRGRENSGSHCRGGLHALPSRAGINLTPTKSGYLKNGQNNGKLQENNPVETNHNENSCCRIDFIWTAGKGGFGMEQSDTLPELASFSEVVEMAIALRRENPSCLVRFHLISSAGGLFEGQRNVNNASLPAPRRPYAFLKLAQEKILDKCDELVRFIYRPTSVYGFAGLNRRMGLITTLLLNASKNKVSTIFGAPDTLRDYVWADDVGAFIAGMIASKTSCSGRFVLALGKPSALFEVLNCIEKILNKKLFCHYVKSGGNADHNTFSTETRPVGWNPVDMETGIRKTYHAMLCYKSCVNLY